MGLEASICLELSTSARKLGPVEGSANPSLERYLDGIAAKVYGAVEAVSREKRLRIFDTGPRDAIEFPNCPKDASQSCVSWSGRSRVS